MAKKFSLGEDLKKMLAAPGQRKRFPHLEKIATDTRRALDAAAAAGADAMRYTVLNSPPTGNKADDGQRVETFTMFDSIGRSKAAEPKSKDRRRRSSVSASFGFPADADGNIKDAPAVPTRGQASEKWRSDPNYFVMQEYGDSMFDEAFYHGMFSQRAGLEAARSAFDAYMKKKGYK
jgi:hypothetical protein